MSHKIKITLLICFLAVCGQIMRDPLVRAQTAPPQKPVNWERFTHQSHLGTISVPGTNHARVMKCESCHQSQRIGGQATGIVPTTERNRQLGLKFPGHQACIECHVAQFTGRPQQTCTICHEPAKKLESRPPQKDFPRRRDFNAFFDARQHELHVAYKLPGSGQMLNCNFCHRQDARPAVLQIASHPECFTCHLPGSGEPKAEKKTACSVCHTAMTTGVQPFSAKYVTRAYGAQFTHKSHVAKLGQRCDMCHTISGGYNQPTPTSLKTRQHITPAERSGRGCFSCHDGGVHFGRRVFSGEPGTEGGGSCDKCHTRPDFKVLPTS